MFSCTVPGEHRVGVAVDEAGQHQASPGIHPATCWRVSRDTQPDNPPFPYRERTRRMAADAIAHGVKARIVEEKVVHEVS